MAARQFQRDETLRALSDRVLLILQEANLSPLQLLDVAHEIQKVGLMRLATERLEEELIRRDSQPRRGGHKAAGK
jgi:hypothetical protein